MANKGRPPEYPLVENLPDDVIFQVVEALIHRKGNPVGQVLKDLKLPQELQPGTHQIHPILERAIDKNMLRLCPSESKALTKQLREHFPLLKQREVTVVDAANHGTDYVSAAAADYVLKQIRVLA